MIEVGLDNGDGNGNPADGFLHEDEIDDSATVCAGAPECEAPAADDDLGTGDLVWDSNVPYSGDELTLPCNNQGTTLDLVYQWTASSSDCVFFNARVSGTGTHPFFAVLDECTGEVLTCGQGGDEFEVESGKTYLLAVEPFSLGDNLGGIEMSGCF